MERKIFIKNMVCNRCIMFIKTKFEKLDIELKHIELGAIIFEEESENDFEKIKTALEENGFEILIGQEEKLVEQTKITIIKLLVMEGFDFTIKSGSGKHSNLDKEYDKFLKKTIQKDILRHQKREGDKLFKYGRAACVPLRVRPLLLRAHLPARADAAPQLGPPRRPQTQQQRYTCPSLRPISASR